MNTKLYWISKAAAAGSAEEFLEGVSLSPSIMTIKLAWLEDYCVLCAIVGYSERDQMKSSSRRPSMLPIHRQSGRWVKRLLRRADLEREDNHGEEDGSEDDYVSQEGLCEHALPWSSMSYSHYAMHHKVDHP